MLGQGIWPKGGPEVIQQIPCLMKKMPNKGPTQVSKNPTQVSKNPTQVSKNPNSLFGIFS
jgi:hypothetical protein